MNPHCLHCIQQRIAEIEQAKENAICQSCETLKMQNAILNQQNEKLLNKLTSKEETVQPVTQEPQKVIQTRHVPFSVKRQQLEQESRERAAALRQAALPDSKLREVKPEIKELEQNLGINTGNTDARTEAS